MCTIRAAGAGFWVPGTLPGLIWGSHRAVSGSSAFYNWASPCQLLYSFIWVWLTPPHGVPLALSGLRGHICIAGKLDSDSGLQQAGGRLGSPHAAVHGLPSCVSRLICRTPALSPHVAPVCLGMTTGVKEAGETDLTLAFIPAGQEVWGSFCLGDAWKGAWPPLNLTHSNQH